MPNEGIGDGTDDPDRSFAEARIQFVFQIDDIWRAVLCGLVVHPVVGGNGHGGTERNQRRHRLVHLAVIGVRLGLSGRVLVLHIIGGRQVHQIRTHGRQKLHAGIEHEQRQIRGVLVRR